MTEDQADILQPLWDWRSAVASKAGPKNPTTRHVLLTLALHMNVKGGSCFPSVDLLVDETGRSKKTVIDHINIAVTEGWLEKSVRGMSGQGWRRHEYRATIPKKGGVGITPPVSQGGIAATPPQSEGGVIEGEKVVYQLHLSSSKRCPLKTPSPKKPATPHQEKKEPNFHRWFVSWWCFVYQQLEKQKYAMTKKDAGQVKQMLTLIGLGDLVVRSISYLATNPTKRFPRDSPATLGGLLCSINQLAEPDNDTIDKFTGAGLLPAEGIRLTSFEPWKGSP